MPEEESPELRPAPIEAEGELVEVPLQMVRLHGALVGSEQPPLEQAGDAMYPGKERVCRDARVGHRYGLVNIVVRDGGWVREQPVRHDDRPRLNAVKQEGA